MRKPPEIVAANKNVKKNFYIFIAVYCLLLIILEPVINYFLLFDVNDANLILINELSQKKKIISEIAYATLRMIPIFWFAWLGYRIITSARLPPAGMPLPFAVPAQEGRAAKKTGLIVISLSLLFIAQNIAYTIRQLNNISY